MLYGNIESRQIHTLISLVYIGSYTSEKLYPKFSALVGKPENKGVIPQVLHLIFTELKEIALRKLF